MLRTGKLVRGKTAFFLCDIQEKFVPVISSAPSVIYVANYLCKASSIFKCPLLVTEQYPRGLGRTTPQITLPQHAKVFDKTKFSMLIPPVIEELKAAQEVTDVVLFGIEAHVCILQTAMDLIEMGYGVHIPADGVSSQRHSDRMIALERLRQIGAFVSTSESVVFQILGDASSEYFREISAISKGTRPESGLFALPAPSSL